MCVSVSLDSIFKGCAVWRGMLIVDAKLSAGGYCPNLLYIEAHAHFKNDSEELHELP